jgi:ABC-type multidrug transport system fused ATPase/permease subunit
VTEIGGYNNAQKEIAFRKWFFSYVKQVWWQIMLLGLLSLAAIALTLLDPWPLKILVDSVFGSHPAPGPLKPYSGSIKLLYITGFIYVFIYVFQNGVAIINGYLGVKFGFKLDIKLKTRLFKHILYLPYKATNRLETADYVYRENVETGAMSATILGSFITIFGAVITVVVIFVVLFILYWKLTALIVLVMPLLYFGLRMFGGRIQSKSKSLEENTSELYVHTQESIENADIVQAFDRQEGQFQIFIALLNKKMKTQLRYNLTLGAFGFVTSIMTVLVIVAIVLIGGTAVFNKQMTVGELLIFISYAGLLYIPLESISSSYASINQNLASMRRVFEIIDDNNDLENVDIGEKIGRLQGQIVFQNVNLSYNGKQVLKDVNLTISPGEKVAFIGPSGAGKSSILSLMMRFLVPDSGFIYLDNYEIHNINLDSLRENISLVEQEPKLFSISIADNIAFYERPGEKYPLPGVMAAAYTAQATDFINNLPDKFDQKVEHEGGSLSGGQKQRIAIARALYKQSPILLLDEPTSAQDISNENNVLDSINTLIKGRTVIMVSHKLSLLSQMDKVYVVDGGKVQDVNNLGGLEEYKKYMESHENN